MKEYEIHINDIKRILFGEVPGSFYIEVILRTLFVYLLLMVCMRLMGKRMSSHLSRNELIAMVSLAAAIGVPMMTPDRGLLPALVIGIIVVGVQRIISVINFRNQRAEEKTQGNLTILISDGMLDLKKMMTNQISRERLFAQLRYNEIDNLGKVKRMYLESSGAFSVIQNDAPLPGLSILPNYDREFRERRQQKTDKMVCNECGNIRSTEISQDAPCERCGETNWQEAYL